MPTPNEIERIAGAMHKLRPDWPYNSLVTHLTANHAERAYRDLAVAATWIATDSATKTPARLIESGPWWQATAATAPTISTIAKKCPDHPTHPAWDCPDCRAVATPPPDGWRNQIPRTASQAETAEQEQES